MVKLSKPLDGKQASFRDKFPILSSLSEHPDNSGARKPSGTRKSSRPASPTSPYPAKPLNRSKSLFSLAQSFFKKVDEADGYTTQPTTHTFGTAHTAKELQYRDPLYHRTSGPHLHDQENTPRRASNITPKVQHGTWNPLASIRGRLDKSFFSVRGRGGPQPQPQPEFDTGVGSPMKRRKSLGGLNNAWGTVGKKFTLRGRKRGQAEAALSAYRREPTDDIELPELGRTIYIDEDCKSSGSMPILGLSSSSRVSSSDSRTTALLDREPPEELEPIIIQKSTNGKKRYDEERTSDISSCSPKTLQPARTRSTSKKVAFASATQLQLMEEAKQRQRVNSGVSDASGCPSLTSADISAIDLSLPTPAPATGAESPVSPRRLSEYAERTMVDEQAEIDLIERMLDDGASLTSVDFDTFHENRRQLRQARYNMLMDPAKQVENFQVFTEVLENTARMLNNVGHADVEVVSRGSSFSGPVYTWTDGEIVMRNDTPMVDPYKVSAEPDFQREEGEGVVHYRAMGILDVDMGNHYNNSIVTVTELVESDESQLGGTPEKASANDMGLEFFAEKRRGRSLGRTPTKNLAVNNRDKSKSPLKRLQVKLTPTKMSNKRVEDASPSSTMAVRCPSPSTASEEESTYTLTPPLATKFERLLDLPKRLISHMWTGAGSEEDFLDNIDVKWLSRKENQTNSTAGPHFYYNAESKLRHHQYREDVRRRREGKLPAITADVIKASEAKGHFNVVSFASGFGEAFIFMREETQSHSADNLSTQLDRYATLCEREQKRKAVRDVAKIWSALEAFQAEEALKFRRGTVGLNDSVHSTVDGTEYFSAEELSPGQASIFRGIVTPDLTPAVASAEPPASPAKFKDVEVLAAEFRKFQIGEELKFKRAHDKKMQREQNKRDGCCQNWGRCEKIGKCFEVRKQEYFDENAKQELERKAEELARQFQKFQAEEEAKFKRSHDRAVQREKTKKGMGWPETLRKGEQCCQYWRSCEKVGSCYEVRTKEYLAMKAKQSDDMEWKKQHWVEGYSCAKRGSTASKEKKDRDTSFTFMAHGKKIRMATYDGSSFFAKTSSTPVISASVRRAMGQEMPLTPELKGKEKASVYDEDSLILDNRIDGMDYNDDCLDGDNHITFDDDFHPQPIFTINPSGYSTAIPGGSSTSSSSGAMSPKSFNNYGNIVRCWSPPDLPPKKQGSNFELGEDIHVAIRGGRGKDSVFEHIQWPPSTQDIFRANYPTNPPGPRTPQRNADSGYWDEEKNAQNGPRGSVPPPDPVPQPEPAPRPSSASPKTAPRSPPHSTAAHLLARFEKKGKNACEVEHNEFIADQHKFLVNTFGPIGSRCTTAQQILSTLEDPHSTEQGFTGEKHAELVKSFTQLGQKNAEELQKVNLELARSAIATATVENNGKGIVPALPSRLGTNYWKGKAQEWPKQPTFIALEPATTHHKTAWNAASLPARNRKITPNLCVQTRNITPQATINGKGPVSPLTKAWLESKNKPQITEKKVEEYISAVEKPYPSPTISYFDAPPSDYHPMAGAGNAREKRQGRHFYANVTGDGKAVQIPPIRMLRPSLTVTDRTVSGVSVAATMVDEEFGEDLVDFRVEGREGKEEEMAEGMGEDGIKEEMDEMEKRVPSWMLYG